MIMRRSSSALQVTFSQLCHVKTLQSFFCTHILTTGQRKQLLAVYSFYAVFCLWFILLEEESHLSFSPWGFVFPFFPHLSFFIFWFKFCLILSWRVLSTTSLKFAWLHLSSFFVPFVFVLFLYFFFSCFGTSPDVLSRPEQDRPEEQTCVSLCVFAGEADTVSV